MPEIQHKRGTRSALTALAAANGLLPGQIYVLTDESRIAVATSVSAFETFAKESEAGGGGSSDPLDLSSATQGTVPADTVRVFRRSIANRQFPAFNGPLGVASPIQSMMARKRVCYWSPPGSSNAAPAVLGFAAFSITGFTGTARFVAATNAFTRQRRLGYVTAATAGSVGRWLQNDGQFTVGNGSGLGGFFYVVRFGISDAAAVSGARMFMGVRLPTAPANVEPSTLTDCIGVGHGAADTNFSIYYGGSAAQTPIDLGASFPSNTRSTDVYELALFSAPSSGDVHWQVTRINTGDIASGSIVNSGSTVLPTASTFLNAWGYRTNNATALAVGLDVMLAYAETDD